MGTYYTTGSAKMTWKEFIFSEIETKAIKIEQCSIQGRVAYLACRCLITNEVFGLVLLLTTSNGDKGYKPLEENCGPLYYDAPKSLIQRLSPTSNEWATKWRTRCLEQASKPKIKEGDRVRFETPIRFRFGGRSCQATDFRAVRYPNVRGLVFESEDCGGLIRVNTKNKNYQIL